jgi:UDP-2,3-diacylglucosamine pyrophosphatase LpxH
MANDNIAAIIISDVHLGALGSNNVQFNSFLKRLSTSPSANLIVAGDFFYLICESVTNLNRRCEQTLDLLKGLQDKGITISEAIGNHEIPVVDPYETPQYSIEEATFQDRKNELKKCLDAGDRVKQVLDKMILGQYLLLERTDGKWVMTAYDSIARVAINPESQFHVLILHGYQLEKKTDTLAKLWKEALEAPDDMKDLIDVFFSGMSKSFEDVFKDENWEQGPDFVKARYDANRKLRKTGPEARDQLFKLVDANPAKARAFMTGFLHSQSKRKYEPIFNDAKTFLDANPNLVGKLNYFMFGHTHEEGVDKELSPTTLVNTGAWQHVKKMTYIQLFDDGNFKIKSVRSLTYWLYVLLGISLIVGQVLLIIWIVYWFLTR